MKCIGWLKDITQDIISRKQTISFNVEGDVAKHIEQLKDKKLSIEIKQFRAKRSLDANGLLWHCLDEIAKALNTDKWEVYLMMLKRYGVFTYGVFKESRVDYVKQMWREAEVVGEVDVNGEKGVQMILYFGSSTYDTKEFSRLLDGVISEMDEMGLPTPAQEEAERLLEMWGQTKGH